VTAVDGNATLIHGITKSVATCNSSSLITGGCFTIKNGVGFVFSSRPTGNSWIVTAAALPGIKNGTLQVHAECAELESKN
jgi:hypothetical protein